MCATGVRSARRGLWASSLAVASAFLIFAAVLSAQSKVIVEENAKPGTTDWILTKVIRGEDEPYSKGWHRRKLVEGFVSHTSLSAGDSLKVFVSTEPADRFRLDIFRMGYYGGKGGRLMRSIGPLQGSVQPTPVDGERNLIECKWKEAATIRIPNDWVSGVYLGKLSTLKTDGEAYIVFVVRDNRKADLLFQASDMTWLSYNRWPNWRSLYDLNGEPWGAGGSTVGYDVSFDKPYALYWNLLPTGFEPLTNGSGEFLLTEFSLAFWLEKEGYDVTYISNVDTHADGPGLLRGRVFLSVGHDEYWTQQMFDNVTKARDAGVNLAFLSGNSISGVVELLPSTDGRPNRVMRRVRGFTTEPELMGSTSYGVGLGDWIVERPDHWLFEGTGMKKGDRVGQLVGWEYHGPPFGKHPDLVVLAAGPVANGRGEPIEGRIVRHDTLHGAEGQSRVQRGNLLVEQGAVGTASLHSPDSQVLQRRGCPHPAHHQEPPQPDARAGQGLDAGRDGLSNNVARLWRRSGQLPILIADANQQVQRQFAPVGLDLPSRRRQLSFQPDRR